MNTDFDNARNINWNIIGKKLKEFATDIAKETNNEIIFTLRPSNNKQINDWSTNKTYDCITQTMYFKDTPDIKSGIGFVYNVIDNNTILIAPVGTQYLNVTHSGLFLENEFIYLKVDELNKPEIWDYLKNILFTYINIKYNKNLNKRT